MCNNGRIIFGDVTGILAYQLTPAARTQLDLPTWPDTADGFEAAYKTARLPFHAAGTVMDPSLLPKRRLSRSDADRDGEEADQEKFAVRQRLLVEETNRLVEASLAPARPHIEAVWDGPVAVDATPIRPFSRGVATSDPHTATNPDAAWYVREGGDHRDPSDTPGGGAKRKTASTASRPPSSSPGRPHQARAATATIPTPTTSTIYPPSSLPSLSTNLAMTLPEMPSPRLATFIGAATGLAGSQPTAPTNAALPETFHIPVRDLGYRPIWDYRIDQLGIQGSHGGALLVDGTWYCPHLPEALITVPSDLLDKKIDKDTWRIRANARAAYRLRPKATPPTAAAPVRCSARRPAPTPPRPAHSNAAASAATPATPSSTFPPTQPDTQRHAARSPSPSPATSAYATGRNSTTTNPLAAVPPTVTTQEPPRPDPQGYLPDPTPGTCPLPFPVPRLTSANESGPPPTAGGQITFATNNRAGQSDITSVRPAPLGRLTPGVRGGT
ncbi:hypothetical protein Sros01_73600 [Streptomyces roseochromogenus]|nr:hypothetical protein Sros01_73600 [Streptomyces roseochromogenus]